MDNEKWWMVGQFDQSDNNNKNSRLCLASCLGNTTARLPPRGPGFKSNRWQRFLSYIIIILVRFKFFYTVKVRFPHTLPDGAVRIKAHFFALDKSVEL